MLETPTEVQMAVEKYRRDNGGGSGPITPEELTAVGCETLEIPCSAELINQIRTAARATGVNDGDVILTAVRHLMKQNGLV